MKAENRYLCLEEKQLSGGKLYLGPRIRQLMNLDENSPVKVVFDRKSCSLVLINPDLAFDMTDNCIVTISTKE